MDQASIENQIVILKVKVKSLYLRREVEVIAVGDLKTTTKLQGE